MPEQNTVTGQIQKMNEQGEWMDTGQTIDIVVLEDGAMAIKQEDIRPFLFGCRVLVASDPSFAYTISATAV